MENVPSIFDFIKNHPPAIPIIVLLIAGIFTFIYWSIPGKVLPYTEDENKIGHYGPAGGIVFYDKGTYSDGWRYIELAPKDTEVFLEWGSLTRIDGTIQETGSARQNTQRIIDFLTKNGETNKAAQYCVELNINGYSDWYLPSHRELQEVYMKVFNKKIGNLLFGRSYWSSTEKGYNEAWAIQMSPGGGEVSKKYSNRCVRAIRYF
jgi:hypothetical protein